jgi:hypothetical protein
LALLEMALVVAMVTQRFRPRLGPGADVKPRAIVLLGPAGPMPLIVTPRRPPERDEA